MLLAKWWRPADWMKLVRAGRAVALGLLLPLVPWAARNWHTLHEVQFLAPRYSELPGEYTPLGFTAWTNTWLWRFRDVYLTQWKVNDEEIAIDDIPAYAFDSHDENGARGGLARGIQRSAHDGSARWTREFREIARERTERHPLRTYVKVPLLRTLTLWFTPRVELLPSSGHLWPLREEWQDDRAGFSGDAGVDVVNMYLHRAGACGCVDGAKASRLGAADCVHSWCARYFSRSLWKRRSRATCWNVFPRYRARRAGLSDATRRQLSSTGSG